jgi:hypothetical protein
MKVKLLKKIKSHPFIIRLLNWEYWPFHLVYSPIYPVWIWYCIKARSLFFFGASNPTIKNAGFLMEPKSEIDLLIPERYKPLTLFFIAGTSVDKIKETVRNNNLQYPLVVKPDIGMQGKAVVKVNNDYELNISITKFTVNFIVQPFIPYPKEVGIFYVRYPNDEYGKITGIVEKEFLSVTGDGISTIENLLFNTPRYVLQIPVLKKLLGETINDILKKGDEKILVPYGNHVRGSLFLDSTYKNTKKIESVIDNACKSIDGFYFGRLDIRFNSFEELAEDKNWSIIELNGAGSEPTHMYDPKHSLLFAWKEIIRHWRMLYKVSMQNKRKGFSFLKYKEGVTMFRENSEYVKKLNEIDFGKSIGDELMQQNYIRPELRVVK